MNSGFVNHSYTKIISIYFSVKYGQRRRVTSFSNTIFKSWYENFMCTIRICQYRCEFQSLTGTLSGYISRHAKIYIWYEGYNWENQPNVNLFLYIMNIIIEDFYDQVCFPSRDSNQITGSGNIYSLDLSWKRNRKPWTCFCLNLNTNYCVFLLNFSNLLEIFQFTSSTLS